MTAAQAQHRTMNVVNRSNPCAGRFGALYSYYIEREWLARLIGRLAWGVDTAPLYRSLDEVRFVREGGTILDVPCGSGLALRALEQGQNVHYLAVDIDPTMLGRAARRAEERGLSQVNCLRADASRLPIADEIVDLCISHGGLHCFSRPAAALEQTARCLRPGGHLVGTTFVRPGTRRQRMLFRGERRRTGLPELWTEAELTEQLRVAGFASVRLRSRRGYAFFRATKPGAAREPAR